MTPTEPELHEGAQLVVFAKDQPEYTPLPASIDPQGVVMTEWEPTAKELDQILRGGRIRLWCWTFNLPLQPVNLEVTDPPGGMRETP